MSRPFTAAEQHHRLVYAGDLSDRHIGRQVRVGDVEGSLTGIVCGPGDRVTLAVLVGGARTWFPLDGGAAVEVWKP